MKRRQENIMPTTILHIALIIFLILMATVFLAPIPEEIEDYKMHEKSNYVLEYATIVKYKESLHNTYTDYTVYYELIDSDNTKYSGMWKTNIKNIEDAKAMIGQKVPIYVYHELKTHRKNLENRSLSSIYIVGIIGGFCILFLIATLISFILRLIMWRKEKSNQEECC